MNVSKSGLSASVGGPGASLNTGKRGVRSTVGVPGSGLSYSKMLSKAGGKDGRSPPMAEGGGDDTRGRKFLGCGCFAFIVAVLIAFISTCSSDSPSKAIASLSVSEEAIDMAAMPLSESVSAVSSDPVADAPRAAAISEPPIQSEADRCPCGTGKVCIGKRGGRFCINPNGSKQYGM